MSITSDIRSYTDTAFEQAHQQFSAVTDSANEFVGKLTGSAKENVTTISAKAGDLRSQAEKALYIDHLRSAVEPYIEQAKSYRHTISSTLTERAETVYNTVKSDPRVAKVIDSAESVSTFVVGTVNERLVKPALSLTGRSTPTTRKKPATTRPAATKPAAKSAAHKSPATKAKTAPAKKLTQPKAATAKKTTAATKTTPATPATS